MPSTKSKRVFRVCKLVEEYVAKLVKEARIEEKMSFAFKLWNYGIRDFDKIADLTDLPLDEVKEMFKGETA